MDRDKLDPSMEKLNSRISEARKARDNVQGSSLSPVGLASAWRLTTEMFAAILVGGGLGWLIDRWLGTQPWLMLVFLGIGLSAGTLNAFRAARRFEKDLE